VDGTGSGSCRSGNGDYVSKLCLVGRGFLRIRVTYMTVTMNCAFSDKSDIAWASVSQ
jgi:hypothetical protein